MNNELIRIIRTRYRSVSELADVLGMTRQTLWNYLNRKTCINLTNGLAVAHALGISPEYLRDLIEQKELTNGNAHE